MHRFKVMDLFCACILCKLLWETLWVKLPLRNYQVGTEQCRIMLLFKVVRRHQFSQRQESWDRNTTKKIHDTLEGFTHGQRLALPIF